MPRPNLATVAPRPAWRRRRLSLLALTAVAMVGMAFPTATAAQASSAHASSNGSVAAFSAALHKLVAMPGGPPGAIAVVQVGSHSQVVSVGFGNVGAKEAPAANDIARIASVAKAFNGAITLALVSQGSLSLDTTVGTVLPNLPSAWAAVTVAQLLQHTSGVPDYIKAPAFLEQFQADPQQVLTPTQILAFVANEPLLFAPGSRYDYSDSDNIILGLMDEAATQGTYQAALARFVTEPLGIPKTTFPLTSALSNPYLRGYDVSGDNGPEDVSTFLNPALAWASGGILSTPAELNTFMRAYVSGKLFNAATRQRQLNFIPGGSGPPGPGANSAGLGIYRYDTECVTVYGHTGNFPGYTSFAAANPTGTRSVDVIVNTQLQDKPGDKPYEALRAAEGLGVCAALHS